MFLQVGQILRRVFVSRAKVKACFLNRANVKACFCKGGKLYGEFCTFWAKVKACHRARSRLI